MARLTIDKLPLSSVIQKYLSTNTKHYAILLTAIGLKGKITLNELVRICRNLNLNLSKRDLYTWIQKLRSKGIIEILTTGTYSLGKRVYNDLNNVLNALKQAGIEPDKILKALSKLELRERPCLEVTSALSADPKLCVTCSNVDCILECANKVNFSSIVMKSVNSLNKTMMSLAQMCTRFDIYHSLVSTLTDWLNYYLLCKACTHCLISVRQYTHSA